MKIYSFPPVSDQNAKVLVLGTMPGVQSLHLNQYYGHRRNAFWKIMFTLFDEPFSTDYTLRKALLLQHKVAVWDVLQACIRQGSLDSAIAQEIPNDFEPFLQRHPNLTHILFNGQKAAHYFRQHVRLSTHCKLITLPSTSPANAGISFEQKQKEWQIINELLAE